MALDELGQDICSVSVIDDEKIALVRAELVSDEMAERLAETFKVLSDPTRVKVVAALLQGELCVCEISEIVGMSQSAVSHQLRKLKDLRLVKRRKHSKMVYYSLDDDHILGLITQGVDHVKEEFPGAHGAFAMPGLEGGAHGHK